MRRKLIAKAPSNIAVLKYMGKRAGNIPENPSISLTLDTLCTWVELNVQTASQGELTWNHRLPEIPSENVPPHLRKKLISAELDTLSQERAIRHLARVREHAPGVLRRHQIPVIHAPSEMDIELSAANTFPRDAGIASSASSFAAMTAAAAAALSERMDLFLKAFLQNPEFRADLAGISRQGSGSSCRSFFGPWVQWEGAEVKAIPTQFPPMSHFVILVGTGRKKVSSSEAHQRVKSSPLWAGRTERVSRRALDLRQALEAREFSIASELAWREMWEMHSLFHTAVEGFTYFSPGTVAAFEWLGTFLEDEHAPIVTLDAGPNPHILVPQEDAELWRNRLTTRYKPDQFIEDREGLGVEILEETRP